MRGILIFHLNFKVFSISRPFPSLTFLNPIHGFWILFQFLFAIFYHSKRDLSRVSPFHFKHFFTFGLESNNIWSRWLWNQFYNFFTEIFGLFTHTCIARWQIFAFAISSPTSEKHFPPVVVNIGFFNNFFIKNLSCWCLLKLKLLLNKWTMNWIKCITVTTKCFWIKTRNDSKHFSFSLTSTSGAFCK